MSERIIIENRSSIPLFNAITYVESVIGQGRVSDGGKSYCHVTTFESDIVVYAMRNKASDRFIVWDSRVKEVEQ